jgi:pimeloyl-ACP methyl ester carboxylesterase
VFFHGAGTVDGFDFATPLSEGHRVIVPYHPGFGESGDDPSLDDMHDYVMHYLELFDALGIDTFHLVGLSMGGYLAAKFSSEHGHRVRKLVMIAPALMLDADYPLLDILVVPGDEIIGLLVSDFDVLAKRLPSEPDLDFIGDRYREATTLARLQWEHPRDRKLARYLHRLKMPTLILWGGEDKIVPVQQAEAWKRYLPHARIQIYPEAGHLVHLERPEVVGEVGGFLG